MVRRRSRFFGNPRLRLSRLRVKVFEMHVPLVDLQAQYKAIKDEVLTEIGAVLDGMRLNPGPNTLAFESEFAQFCGAQYAIGVGSGTEALHLALRAYGIGPGDEVITVAHTFVATSEAIVLAGATPVFVDVDSATHTMDPIHAEAAVTPRTKALLPVHLYGQCADMASLGEVAERHGLIVIEDACQAHGARFRGRRAGVLGHAAAFSFYCGKNLGAYGEAGMVVTDDPEAAEVMRLMRDHGSEAKYRHSVFGVNGRIDEIQAAVLRVKLRYLDEWNALRRRHADAYRGLLSGLLGVRLPSAREGCEHVYHLYVIEHARRDWLQERLMHRGIGTGVHYPIPVHLHPPYRQYGGGVGSLPVTEEKAQCVLSLPMYPELTEDQIAGVAEAFADMRQLASNAA